VKNNLIHYWYLTDTLLMQRNRNTQNAIDVSLLLADLRQLDLPNSLGAYRPTADAQRKFFSKNGFTNDFGNKGAISLQTLLMPFD
jgi:hypothetical protein